MGRKADALLHTRLRCPSSWRRGGLGSPVYALHLPNCSAQASRVLTHDNLIMEHDNLII